MINDVKTQNTARYIMENNLARSDLERVKL